ncbi:hypothetical protein ES703_124429 [subsurface metagenome]
MISVRLGPFQAPVSTLGSIICWPFRQLAGTPSLNRKIDELRVHISAMTDIFHIVVADLMGTWSPEKRERVQRAIANFTIVDSGLRTIKPLQNPFTPDELERLQIYNQRAQSGEFFSPEEAYDFRQLSERAAHEYASQDWVSELLKVGLFIFALYGLSQLFKGK